MTPSDRQTLEQRLLAKPFDLDLRRQYAALLQEVADYAAARDQWQLLLEQGQRDAALHLELAYALWQLGDEPESQRELARAEECTDFSVEATRYRTLLAEQRAKKGAALPSEDASSSGQPSNGEPAHGRAVPLRVIGGGASREPGGGEVISISRSSAVRFSDVIGMAELKKLLRVRIIEPFVNPGLFQRFKKQSGGGVLLYGPPGCGKTMIARAIATECKASFTAVGISDILSMWIGESERHLAAIFEKARADVPAVLFFDELDALAFSRSKASSDHTRTLVNEFLAQLDGMSGANEKVLVLAATNMPWDVDEAMKRPGRFDRQIFVPPPDAEARAKMLEAKLRDVPCEKIDFAGLTRRAEHFSGADIDGWIDHAKDNVLSDILDGAEERPLTELDLMAALEQVTPSTIDWLKTSRNLVKFGGAASAYKDVEAYLRKVKLY